MRITQSAFACLFLTLGGCSYFHAAPALRPALPTNGCKPAAVVDSNKDNFGLALNYMGAKDEAREHFIEAANLAPGNQVIWDSPALHPYGEPQKEKKASSKPATEQAPGAFGNRSRMGGGY